MITTVSLFNTLTCRVTELIQPSQAFCHLQSKKSCLRSLLPGIKAPCETKFIK